jgi:ABC-type proline/glycine betaine transport system permease subunit
MNLLTSIALFAIVFLVSTIANREILDALILYLLLRILDRT